MTLSFTLDPVYINKVRNESYQVYSDLKINLTIPASETPTSFPNRYAPFMQKAIKMQNKHEDPVNY